MNKMVKKLKFGLLVIIFVFLGLILPSYHVSGASKNNGNKVERYTTDEIESIIDGIIHWAKQGNDTVLNETYLQMAGDTAGDWFPIGMGRYGYRGESYQPYISTITSEIQERYKTSDKLHAVKSTEWHRITLAMLAMGGDPSKIYIREEGKKINLIADGSYNFAGRRGVDGQGINGAIWALIQVDSMNYPIPQNAKYQRDDLISLITKRQLEDGGFTLSGKYADPDITGMALQALAPYYNSPKTYISYKGTHKTIKQIVDESLDTLSKSQREDGDFASWGTVNVESTVQVLTAICTLGIDPYEDERFIKNGKTLIDGIMKYRAVDGGFAHSYVNDPENPSAQAGKSNRMATEQTLYGLVSYLRYEQDMRNVYDFREEIQNDRIILYDEEFNIYYVQEYKRNQKKIQISLSPLTERVKVINLPYSLYGTTNIALDSSIPVNKGKINIKLNTRKNESITFHIQFKLDEKAESRNIYNAIKLLTPASKINVSNKLEALNELTWVHNRIEETDEKVLSLSKSAYDKLERIRKKIEKISTLELNDMLKELEVISMKIKELPEVMSLKDKKELRNQLLKLNILKGKANELEESISSKKTLKQIISAKKNIQVSIELMKEKIQELEEREEALDYLDELIRTKINHRRDPITIQHKELVEELRVIYNTITEQDRSSLYYYDDLILAFDIMEQLLKDEYYS